MLNKNFAFLTFQLLLKSLLAKLLGLQLNKLQQFLPFCDFVIIIQIS